MLLGANAWQPVRKLPGKTEADPPSLFSGLKAEDRGPRFCVPSFVESRYFSSKMQAS